jgi:fluoroacetyl-CoA thioesterase
VTVESKNNAAHGQTKLEALSVRVLARPEDSAERWGNEGLPVLSTPAIIGHMETACLQLLEPLLGAGQMTVGTAVDMRHLAPVRVGRHVLVNVWLTEMAHKITVEFEITDENDTLVASGQHRRAIVAVEDFIARLRGAEGS